VSPKPPFAGSSTQLIKNDHQLGATNYLGWSQPYLGPPDIAVTSPEPPQLITTPGCNTDLGP
jgi:hypothetical protein